MAIYIFLDEGGNLDFGARGSRYFSLTSMTLQRPFGGYAELDDLRYRLVEYGLDFEYFHAANDNPKVRSSAFGIIRLLAGQAVADCLLIDKSKTDPDLRQEVRFYPQMLGCLLKSVVACLDLKTPDEIIVITDTLPLQRKRRAMEKAVQMTLSAVLPPTCRFRVMHHRSRSHYGLQMADYVNWAVWRKWEQGKKDHYGMIAPLVRNELDILSEPGK